VCTLCAFIIYTIVSLAMIVVGTTKLKHCAARPEIALFLIIMGCTCIMSTLMAVLIRHTLRRRHAVTVVDNGADDSTSVASAGDVSEPTIGSFSRHVPFAVSALLQIVVLVLGTCTRAHTHNKHPTGAIMVYTADVRDVGSPLTHVDAAKCDRLAYLFAFWLVTVTLASLIGIILLTICMCSTMYMLFCVCYMFIIEPEPRNSDISCNTHT